MNGRGVGPNKQYYSVVKEVVGVSHCLISGGLPLNHHSDVSGTTQRVWMKCGM